MVVATRETGKIITCMVMESILGRMEENMMASTSKIGSMVSEFILGQMDVNMKVSGKTDASMEKALTGLISIANHVKGNGKKVKEKNGLKMFEKNS